MECRVSSLFSPSAAEELGLPREDGPLGLPIYFRPLLLASSVLLILAMLMFIVGSAWSIVACQAPCWLLLTLGLANIGVAGRAHAQRMYSLRAISGVVATGSVALWIWRG